MWGYKLQLMLTFSFWWLAFPLRERNNLTVNLETYNCIQERIKGTEKASPIHTLFHR